MAVYYIHKVGSQEMGSVRERGDRPARGRYFLISKTCLDFFPHISSIVLNDKIILSVIPLMEGCEDSRVICTMDYHNQKFADITYMGRNPRNEVRLYMNNSIDPDRQYFFKDDLAIFEKFEINDEIVYSLSKIEPTNPHYNYLISLVRTNDTRFKSNIIIDTEFDFIRKPNFDEISNIVVTNEAETVIERETKSIIATVGDDFNESDDESIEDSMGSSFFNKNLFHDLVLNAYQYKCAITRKVIRYKDGNTDLINLEAAHIKPHAHNGQYLPCNGIALSRDLHFAFDKGFFTISDDYKVVVSEKLRGDWFYDEYNGKSIYVPKEPFYRPEPTFLNHHRNKVFDHFKQIRRLE